MRDNQGVITMSLWQISKTKADNEKVNELQFSQTKKPNLKKGNKMDELALQDCTKITCIDDKRRE